MSFDTLWRFPACSDRVLALILQIILHCLESQPECYYYYYSLRRHPHYTLADNHAYLPKQDEEFESYTSLNYRKCFRMAALEWSEMVITALQESVVALAHLEESEALQARLEEIGLCL